MRPLLALGAILSLWGASVGTAQIQPKPATPITAALNVRVYGTLDFSSEQDFEDATRGFIAGLESPRVIANDVTELNDLGFYAWDLEAYEFLDENPVAPPSVNPSLWRQERLNNINGLF